MRMIAKENLYPNMYMVNFKIPVTIGLLMALVSHITLIWTVFHSASIGNEFSEHTSQPLTDRTTIDSVDLSLIKGMMLFNNSVEPLADLPDTKIGVIEMLVGMKVADQSVRDSLHIARNKYKSYHSSNVKHQLKVMSVCDSINRIKLKSIFKKYNWPKLSSFGDSATEAAFLIILHSDLPFQRKYLPLMEAAANQHEVNPLEFAIVVDRVAKLESRKQVYGTHGRINKIDGEVTLLPIVDEQLVNERRLKIGLQPLDRKKCEMSVFDL